MRAGYSRILRRKKIATVRPLAIVFAIAMFGILGVGAAAFPAWGANWPKAPDGRVIIPLNGVRLAFPSGGNGIDAIRFNLTPREESRTLRQVLDAPKAASRIFSAREQNTVNIAVPSSGEFLGRFRASDYKGMSFGITTGKNAQALCRALDKEAEDARRKLEERSVTSSADDFAEIMLGHNPPKTLHLLVSRQSGDAPRIREFACDVLANCGSTVCVGSNAEFTFRFPEGQFQKKSWIDMLAKASAIIDQIFIDTGAPGKTQ